MFSKGEERMKTSLYIDVSDLSRKMQQMQSVFDEETFKKILLHTIRDTSRKVKTISKRRIREDYQIGSMRILRSFGSPKITTGAEISCLIPIKNVRGTIASSGGAYKALKRGPGAKILKAGNSILPHSKSSERIHFYIPSGRLAGHVFVRHNDGKRWTGKRPNGKWRLRKGSISHGVGIGVPQMPMNRSEPEIQRDILEYMGKRLEHYQTQMLRGVIK